MKGRSSRILFICLRMRISTNFTKNLLRVLLRMLTGLKLFRFAWFGDRHYYGFFPRSREMVQRECFVGYVGEIGYDWGGSCFRM